MTRYFSVQGKAREEILQLLYQDLQAQKDVKKLCKEFQAESAMLGSGFGHRSLSGFTFKGPPDLKTWKKHREGFWTPRSSTKEGKALRKRLDAVKLIGGMQVAKIIGMACFKGMTCYTPGVEQYGELIVVKVPDYVTPKCEHERITDVAYELLESEKRRGAFKTPKRKAKPCSKS